MCDPLARVEVLTRALSPVRAIVPRDVVPSKNDTEPVGVPEVLVTWLVKVTFCPNVEGLRLETSETAGAALFTVWVTDALSLPKFASPP